MDTLKPFDPSEIDETLTRIVTHGGDTYLMFPYINATDTMPVFHSISHIINGPAATIEDFHALTALLRKAGENARWRISFSTPWLTPISESGIVEDRRRQSRTERR
jgi:hypothetical protein